jgi:hypothetical protein
MLLILRFISLNHYEFFINGLRHNCVFPFIYTYGEYINNILYNNNNTQYMVKICGKIMWNLYGNLRTM